MLSVSITTKGVSLNQDHGEAYSIQHFVIKFVSDLQQFNIYYIFFFLFRDKVYLFCLSCSIIISKKNNIENQQ